MSLFRELSGCACICQESLKQYFIYFHVLNTLFLYFYKSYFIDVSHTTVSDTDSGNKGRKTRQKISEYTEQMACGRNELNKSMPLEDEFSPLVEVLR